MLLRSIALLLILLTSACTQIGSSSSSTQKGDTPEEQKVPPHLLNNLRLWNKVFYRQTPSHRCVDPATGTEIYSHEEALQFTEDRRILKLGDSCSQGVSLARNLETLDISADNQLVGSGPGIYLHSNRIPTQTSAYMDAWCLLGSKQDQLSWEWRIRADGSGNYSGVYMIIRDGMDYMTLNDMTAGALPYNVNRTENGNVRSYLIHPPYMNGDTLLITIPLDNPSSDGTYEAQAEWKLYARQHTLKCRITK